TLSSTKDTFERHKVVFTILTSVASIATAWAGYTIRHLHETKVEQRLDSIENAMKKNYDLEGKEFKKLVGTGSSSAAACVATAGVALVVGYGLGWRGGRSYAQCKFKREQMKLLGQDKPKRWQLKFLKRPILRFRKSNATVKASETVERSIPTAQEKYRTFKWMLDCGRDNYIIVNSHDSCCFSSNCINPNFIIRSQRQSRVPLRYEDTVHNINNSKTTKKKNEKRNQSLNKAGNQVNDGVKDGDDFVKDVSNKSTERQNQEDAVLEGEVESCHSGDSVEDNNENLGDINNEVLPKQNLNSYASMVKMDDMPKNLEFIPTVIVITDNGNEVVIFDEEIVLKGSEKWSLTVCDEIGMNAVIEKGPWMVKNKPLFVHKWSSEIGMIKLEPKKMPVWVKITRVPLEAKGISALASRDSMTASMCHKGIGNLSYARVLVEMDAAKELKNEVEIHYVDKNKNVKGSEKVQVVYDWKPPVCTHCKVFGHEKKKCKNGGADTNDADKIGSFNNNLQNQTEANGAWRMDRKKQNDEVNIKGKEGHTVKNNKWKVKEKVVEELKRTANKFSVLNTLPEDNDQELRTLKERMVVDKFLNENLQPNLRESITWMGYFMRILMDFKVGVWNIRGMNTSEKHNEVMNLIRSESIKVCAILETRLRTNEGLERKSLWDELVMESRFVDGKPWCIAGDLNVTLKPNEHSCGSSGMTSDMMDFQECLNKIEVEDICKTGLYFTWTKNLLKTKAGCMTGILKKLNKVMSNEEKWSKEVHGFQMYQVVQKLKSLKIPLKKLGWSKGNLFKRVESLRGQLQKVQTDIDKDLHNHSLREREAMLVKELHEAEEDEEKFLFQPAKIKWLSDGDKNSSYFHKILKGRNNRSKILKLSDDVGINYEYEQIPQLFLKHFEGFLGKAQLKMVEDVSDKEIKKAIFEIDDSKAPGPDGFTTAFFKKTWGIIGVDVCKAIKEFFISGKLLGEINATLISLIPKVQTPSRVTDFRPIACCNVLYKCISKIITNRIKPVLGYLVSSNQSAFILGRHIQDNILFTQELMKGYNRKGGPKRVAIKIDLQKAYDTVSWSFLKKVLVEFRFQERMVHWIMQCVSTVGFTLNVNGERVGYFKGGRGLRQGDPISLYLFTLIMEIFSLMLKRQIEKDPKFQYHFGCKDLKLVHVCFADDLLVMCHGDSNSVKVIKRALDEFSACSGLLPNNSKSTVFFGSLCEEEKEDITNVLPFVFGKLPVRYLGVPLIAKRLSVKECGSLIDKIKSKVKSWKNRSLSYAGRLQLIDAVLESVHVYWASVFLLPTTIVNEINKLPKNQGGLRLKNLQIWNQALLAKNVWNIANKKDSLWVKWVHSVKLRGESIWEVSSDITDSWRWKILLDIRDLIMENVKCIIRNGNNTSIWYDNWSNLGHLFKFISHRDLYDARLKNDMTVSDMISNGHLAWPEECYEKFPEITHIDCPVLDTGIMIKLFGETGMVIMYTRGRNKADANPAPPARDPRDVEMIEQLQQWIQELELQRLRPDSPAEEAKTEPNVWDAESVDVNPFGGRKHRYVNRLYQPRRDDHAVDREDRYRDDPIRSLGLKIEIPKFTGKVHPDDFIDWLSTVERVFDVRDIPDKVKVKLVAIKLRQRASLWRRIERKSKVETWEKMKKLMKAKFLPENHRQEAFLDYHIEEEEKVVAWFLGVLKPEIADIISLQPYWTYTDVCRLALKVEKQIKAKSKGTTSRFTPPTRTAPPTAPKTTTPITSAAGNTRERVNNAHCCYKCNGIGHYARDCPNLKTLAFIPDDAGPIYDTDAEPEVDKLGDELVYHDRGEALVIQRVLNVAVSKSVYDNSWLRNNIFRTKCTSNGKIYDMIIDGGSCENVVSTYMVEKLGMKTEDHPQPPYVFTPVVVEENEIISEAPLPVQPLLREFADDPLSRTDTKQWDLILQQAEFAYNRPWWGSLVRKGLQSEQIKELHRSVQEQIIRHNKQYKVHADKRRKQVLYREGDLVWIHLLKERFPAGRFRKLKPRGDGPFRVLKKINDKAYKIELPGHYNVSVTFNVTDLSPYKGDSDDEPDSGSSLFLEGEDDADAVNERVNVANTLGAYFAATNFCGGSG
nr:RNA-directed DNA polymerase, eukaryota, reverse transcriptase zinc-binding domain protein [Tanacetum cinerariifolium]